MVGAVQPGFLVESALHVDSDAVVAVMEVGRLSALVIGAVPAEVEEDWVPSNGHQIACADRKAEDARMHTVPFVLVQSLDMGEHAGAVVIGEVGMMAREAKVIRWTCVEWAAAGRLAPVDEEVGVHAAGNAAGLVALEGHHSHSCCSVRA